MVSAIHQCELAIGVHMSPPSSTSLPPHLPPLGCHRVPALHSLHHTANSHWLSTSHMVMYMFQCYSLTSSHRLLTPLYPKVCSLCLCLLCCPASRIISIVFLDSMCAQSVQSCWLFATLWAVACQASLSFEFSRHEYWSVAILSSSGYSQPRNQIIPTSPALQVGYLPLSHPGSP